MNIMWNYAAEPKLAEAATAVAVAGAGAGAAAVCLMAAPAGIAATPN